MCKTVLGVGDMKMNPRWTVFALKDLSKSPEGTGVYMLQPTCEWTARAGEPELRA